MLSTKAQVPFFSGQYGPMKYLAPTLLIQVRYKSNGHIYIKPIHAARLIRKHFLIPESFNRLYHNEVRSPLLMGIIIKELGT